MKPTILTGHSRPIKEIKFNQEDDLLFTSSVDRYITLWGTETKERIGTYFHNAAISSMNISRDSKYLISTDKTGSLYVWDVSNGHKIKTIEFDVSNVLSSIDFGVSDNQICISKSTRQDQKSSIYIFKLEDILKASSAANLEEMSTNTIELDKRVKFAKFINTNTSLLCAYESGLIQTRNIKDNTVIREEQMHSKEIMDLDLTGKEELALSSSKDGKSILFDPETLDILNVFAPDSPLRNINSGKISPLFNPLLPEKDQLRHCFIGGGQDSQQVTFTRSSEGGFEILIYDMISGKELGAIPGHFSPINSIAISNNGSILASGGEEATVRVYSLNNDYYRLKDF